MLTVDSVPVIENFFHLTFVQNPGVAFGFFRNHGEVLLICIAISLLILFAWSRALLRISRSYVWPMGFILGGALGNFIDRLRFRAVIDFLDFRVWPIFNIADTAITTGVILYFLLIMKNKKKESSKESSLEGNPS